MTQQTSPFLEGKYGWNYGESGWNTGMDENLLKFSFMFDRNVDGIVSSLPAAVNGQAYFLTTDNRLYFAIGTIWFSSPTPKWFEFKIRSTGNVYLFNGTSAVQIDSPSSLDSRLDAVEVTLSSLGTAAYQDVSAFATQAALDVAVGQSQAYTDVFKASLSASTGASLVGAGVRTQQQKNQDVVSVKDFGAAGDGVTNDTTAIQSAINSGAKTLYFPAGIYLVTSLTLVSNQKWLGAGKFSSILSWAQSNIPSMNYSMVSSASDLSGVSVSDMGFRGNRGFQTTNSVSGQDMGCFHLRGGSVEGFELDNCRIYEFGDSAGVGGFGVLIGAVSGTGKKISDIKITNNSFENIANVPGVYINGNESFHTEFKNLVLTGNSFSTKITTSDQNCIYILGSANNIAKSVTVNENNFYAEWMLDCSVELNYCRGFSVSSNNFIAKGSGLFTPILIRDGSSDGVVHGNTIQGDTGAATGTAIAVIGFTSTANTQNRISVTDNAIYNFGTSSTGVGISLSGGCNDIICSGNIISGLGLSSKVGSAITVGDNAKNLRIFSNTINYSTYALTFAGVSSYVDFENNTISFSGDGVSSSVVSNSSNQDLTYINISENKVKDVVSGTTNFISISPAVSTGNRVDRNIVPSGVQTVNPSYLSKFISISSTPLGQGQVILGTSYTFAQGSLPMSDGQGFTIGAGLDPQAPKCKLGDMVVASFVGDIQGVTVNAYVSAANTVRIRVQNETGASVTIAAGDWKVLIIPV